MGRKKNRDSKTREFQHTPFRELKGVSVLPEREGAPQQPGPRPAPPEPREDGELFSAEMERLGVVRDGEPERPESCPGDLPPAASKEPAGGDPGDPRDEFLAALGQLEVTFGDELPGDEPPPQRRAAARRMRRLRQGSLMPEARLDLHGLHREAALEKVGWFLENAVYRGLETVLIVTGKGRHSPEGPVLRETVGRYLAAGGEGRVLEWGPAPRRHGGDGALVVFLRSRSGANQP